MSLWSNLEHKWRRWQLPKGFRHHAHAHPQFALQGDPAGPRTICWQGQTLGHTVDPQQLRNSRSGDCFIVCSGPSLRDVDLAKLAGYPSFAVNGAIARFRECGLSPTYYAATDPDFFDHRMEMVRAAIVSQSTCFFSFAGLSRICEREPQLLSATRIVSLDTVNQRYGAPRRRGNDLGELLKSDQDFVLHSTAPLRGDAVGFCKNIAKGVFCGRNIAFRAIQAAYHLGFRRLHLLGMDLGGQGPLLRFYETQQTGRQSSLDRHYEPYIRPTFEIVREMIRQEQFAVDNLSSQSRLPDEIIPKRELADVLRAISSVSTNGTANRWRAA